MNIISERVCYNLIAGSEHIIDIVDEEEHDKIIYKEET
jgi:hypothetical protein